MATDVVRTIPEIKAQMMADMREAADYLETMRSVACGIHEAAGPGLAHHARKAGEIAAAKLADAQAGVRELIRLLEATETPDSAGGSAP